MKDFTCQKGRLPAGGSGKKKSLFLNKQGQTGMSQGFEIPQKRETGI